MERLSPHKPVMADEVIRFLHPSPGEIIFDATIGCGGHSALLLNHIKPNGILIGVDRDSETLKFTQEELKRFGDIVRLSHRNFKDIDKILLELQIGEIDAALFDLGISSYQLDKKGRGFSFTDEKSLDMRMDVSSGPSAYEIVNRVKSEDLERIIRDFGEERHFRRITRFIIEARKSKPIESSFELTEIIKRAVGRFYRAQKINPATRTFQGIRIAVNEELRNIEEALSKTVRLLRPGGRICVISFHSLEDRIVKNKFREFKSEGLGEIITKKPITPKDEEKKENPRSRSAKMRVFKAKDLKEQDK